MKYLQMCSLKFGLPVWRVVTVLTKQGDGHGEPRFLVCQSYAVNGS